MKGVTTIAILLFASIGLNAFLAIEREHNRETLDEARRHGFVAVEERPGCGWVRVPRCGNCGRFHASPPRRPPGPCAPSLILPGPVPEIEVYPTPAPTIWEREEKAREDSEPAEPTFDDAPADPHESYRRPIDVLEQLYAGP